MYRLVPITVLPISVLVSILLLHKSAKGSLLQFHNCVQIVLQHISSANNTRSFHRNALGAFMAFVPHYIE